jgi:hypothetical protein
VPPLFGVVAKDEGLPGGEPSHHALVRAEIRVASAKETLLRFDGRCR